MMQSQVVDQQSFCIKNLEAVHVGVNMSFWQ